MMKAVVHVVSVVALLLAAMPEGIAQSATGSPSPTLCASCHGIHGEGSSSGAPRLAGQNPDYLRHALSMFKAGTRASPVMQPIASALSEADIQALTDQFSRQSAPPVDAKAAASPQLLRAGKQLTEAGSAPCFGCHGPGGRGAGSRYPSIAAQPAQFITNRIHEFQSRARAPTPQPGSMTAVSTTLSEDQVKAAAAFLSQLPR